MNYKVGQFSKSTNTVVPVDQPVTGVGFKPKMVIFWGTLLTADGSAAPHNFNVGVSVGTVTNTNGQPTDNCCTTIWAANAVSTTQANRATNTTSYCVVDNHTASTANRVVDGTLKSFDADGFTITWNTNNATAYVINYMAFGGDEFQAKIVNYGNPGGTGNTSFTGAGFAPDFVMFLTSGHTVWPSQTLAANFNFGVGLSASKRWAFSYNSVDAVSMSSVTMAIKNQRTDSCTITMANSGTVITERSDFVSLDADGCTINFISNGPGGSLFVIYMKGGQYDVGNFAKSTAAAPVTDAIVTSFANPQAFLINTFGAPASTAVTSDANHSWGACTTATDECVAVYQKDLTLPTVADQSTTSTKGLRIFTGPSTVNAEADVTPTATGANVAWTTNDGNADQILWVAFGSKPLPPPPFPNLPQPVLAQ